MATEYRINMNRFNGTDYDIMYPRTLTEQVINGQRQIVISSVSLSTTWSGSGPYTQVVTVDGADAKSKVDLQPDATIIESLSGDGVTAIYVVNDNGTLTAVATGAAPTTALDIQCSIEEVVEYTPPVSNVLDDNSWSTIKWVSNHNLGSNYWSVGDTKKIVLNYDRADNIKIRNFETYVYIIGFNHNETSEGKGITFQGFKTAQTGGTDICLVDYAYNSQKTSGTWFNMNNTLTNSGSWEACLMRKNVMPLIKSAFPADLQAVIKTSTIFTAPNTGDVALTATQDEVFLLAEYEISGAHFYASTQESSYLKQYSYYSVGNSKLKYKHNATSEAANWFERSPDSLGPNSFCFVNAHGYCSSDAANKSLGVAPCFKV